jgi:shikimate kinase
MGSGKTTIGRSLAKKLNLRFVDADQEIEAHLRTFLLEGETVTMQHYIAER